MSKQQSTTKQPFPAQQTSTTPRPQSKLDWNFPTSPSTPRGEYDFMREYSMVWAHFPSNDFGPCSGGLSAEVYL